MKYRQFEYSRTFNLGDYQSERISLTVDLDEIEDLDEVFRTTKVKVFHLYEEGELLEESKAVAESSGWLEVSVLPHFPKDLVDLLIFEVRKDSVIIKPKEFLGSENFAKIAAIVRNLKGEYVSDGRDSHFKIPKNP